MSSPTIQPAEISHLKAVPSGSASSGLQKPTGFSGKRIATRHRLMDACGAIIVRDGFEAVSMTSVAEEAGITRQTVYRYFPNAREVVRAALMRSGRELLEGQLLVFSEDGEPRELLIEAIMAALRLIENNALLRTAWASRDYPQAMLRSTFDPAFASRAVEGLKPIARRLGWGERDTEEAYEVIARTVMSFLTIPPRAELSESDLRDMLHRRLLPALGA
jgi:AcrR family transcriptional regulator